MPKRAACYCRVSTRKDDQLDSLEKQKEFFVKFFHEHTEYALCELYADEGISAKSMRNRRAFARMLEDARRGLFDAVFVKDVSRFARNVQDFYRALEVLEAAGVRVHFVTMGLRSEEASRFSLGLMALLAEDESERLSVKVKFGKNVTAGRGRVPNFVFGYQRVDAFTLRPDPGEAAWVRRIFSMYVHQGMGAARIAQCLNDAGIPSKRGLTRAWTQSQVCQLLKNPLYSGKVANKKSEVADFRTGRRTRYEQGQWVVCEREDFRIVEEDIFSRAQELLRERAAAARHSTRQSAAHPLSNLVRCGCDGRAMRRVRRADGAYWVCSVRNARGVDACPNAARVSEGWLMGRLTDIAMAALRGEPKAAAQIERRFWELLGREAAAPKADARALRESARRYREMYAAGLMEYQELTRALEGVRERLAEAEFSLSGEEGAERLQLAGRIGRFVEGREAFISNAFLKRWVDEVRVGAEGEVELVMLGGSVVRMDASPDTEQPLSGL